MSTHDATVHVLFVCTGNTCRSPLAAAGLRAELGVDAERVHIASAGTSAWEGQPASEGSQRVAREAGLDLAEHRSRRLTAEMAGRTDFLFVMENSHRAAVEALGVAADRVRVLSDWPAPGEPELPVSDPFGGSQEAYEECWRRIRWHVQRIVPHVREALRARTA